MPMKNETSRVVYIHPKGYYAIVERRGEGKLGGEYCIRETIYPPFPWQKNELAPKLKPRPEPVQTIKTVCVTEQDKTRFAKLYRQGYTTVKIAEICGWSKVTVFKYLEQMGLIRKQKRLTDCDKAQIENLAQNGATGAQIAVVVGFDATTVNKYLRSIGMRKDKPRQTEGKGGEKRMRKHMKADRVKLELALARACMMPYQVARKAGIGRTTINYIMAGRSVKPATLGRVALALGVDVADIMQREG